MKSLPLPIFPNRCVRLLQCHIWKYVIILSLSRCQTEIIQIPFPLPLLWGVREKSWMAVWGAADRHVCLEIWLQCEVWVYVACHEAVTSRWVAAYCKASIMLEIWVVVNSLWKANEAIIVIIWKTLMLTKVMTEGWRDWCVSWHNDM